MVADCVNVKMKSAHKNQKTTSTMQASTINPRTTTTTSTTTSSITSAGELANSYTTNSNANKLERLQAEVEFYKTLAQSSKEKQMNNLSLINPPLYLVRKTFLIPFGKILPPMS